MKGWKAAFLLAGLGWAGPSPAAAPEPLRLDLAGALRTALAQNPAVQRQALEQARQEAQVQEARGALLPTVQGQAGEVRQKINFEALAGMPVPGFPRVVGPFSVQTLAASAQVPLLDLSLWRRWQGARSTSEGAKAETVRVREEIAALVVGQYLLGLRDEAQTRAVSARIELARTLEQLAVHQEDSGVGTGLDTLRAKVRTQTEEQALIRARTALREAEAGMARLLDLPGDQDLALEPLADFPSGSGSTLDQDLAAAQGRRAEYRVLEAQGRAADQNTAAAAALALPTVQAFGTYETLGLTTTNLLPVYEVGVQVSIPLFQGGRVQARESQARAERAQVDTRRRDLEAQVRFEVATARERLEASRAEAQVARRTLELARAELEQARHRFEAGVSSNIELVTAQEELARAEEGHLDADYRLDQAWADLAHAKGELESKYGL